MLLFSLIDSMVEIFARVVIMRRDIAVIVLYGCVNLNAVTTRHGYVVGDVIESFVHGNFLLIFDSICISAIAQTDYCESA
jgi:hypothetical protein